MTRWLMFAEAASKGGSWIPWLVVGIIVLIIIIFPFLYFLNVYIRALASNAAVSIWT